MQCPKCKLFNTEVATKCDCGFDLQNDTYTEKPAKIKIVVAILFVLSCLYMTTGFFVIHPMGILPKGSTVFFWRVGTDLPFISSTEGIVEDSGQDVSILSRVVVMAGVVDKIKDGVIIRLPYSEFLYSISTKQ